MLSGLLAGLRQRVPGVRCVVLSGDPDATRAMHDVEAHARTPAEAWRALAGARLLISGGGSLVQDVTSARSALYYLGVMAAAAWQGVPVAVVGQGVGPIERQWVRRLAGRAFGRAQILSVRDATSAGVLADLGVRSPVHVGADLALIAPAADEARARNLLGSVGLDRSRGLIGVAVRPWPGLVDAAGLGDGVRRVAATYGFRVAVIPFDRRVDGPLSREVATAAGGELLEVAHPQDLLALVGAMDVVLGVRLHALVFAVSQGVPAVGLAYDPKVSAFMSEVNLPGLLSVDATGLAVAEMLARTVDARSVLRSRVKAAQPVLRARAASSLDLVASLLKEDAAKRPDGAGVPREWTE